MIERQHLRICRLVGHQDSFLQNLFVFLNCFICQGAGSKAKSYSGLWWHFVAYQYLFWGNPIFTLWPSFAFYSLTNSVLICFHICIGIDFEIVSKYWYYCICIHNCKGKSTLAKPCCPLVFLAFLSVTQLKLYTHLSHWHWRIELRVAILELDQNWVVWKRQQNQSRNFMSGGRHMFSKPNLAVTL